MKSISTIAVIHTNLIWEIPIKVLSYNCSYNEEVSLWERLMVVRLCSYNEEVSLWVRLVVVRLCSYNEEVSLWVRLVVDNASKLFTVVTMTWNHNPVLSSFINYYRISEFSTEVSRQWSRNCLPFWSTRVHFRFVFVWFVFAQSLVFFVVFYKSVFGFSSLW
jgi:hypothetical protein